MISFQIPEAKKSLVIISIDAKNEVDDPFAIVQASLSESMEIKAFIAAHFGTEKSHTSMLDSYDEIHYVLKRMGRENEFRVLHGAERAMKSEDELLSSDGSRFLWKRR